MITTALIRPAFVADTLRQGVIECTYKAYVPPPRLPPRVRRPPTPPRR